MVNPEEIKTKFNHRLLKNNNLRDCLLSFINVITGRASTDAPYSMAVHIDIFGVTKKLTPI